MISPRKIFKRIFVNPWTIVLLGAISTALISNAVFCSSTQRCASLIDRYLLNSEIGVLVGTLALFVTVYRFAYLRPELLVYVTGDDYVENPDGDGYVSVLNIYLVNAGNRFAEDVQLMLTLDAFQFDNEIEMMEHPTADYEILTSDMDIRSGQKIGFLGGGTHHDIYFGNVLYEEDVRQLYFGKAVFRTESTNKIKYQVGCRSHGLRQGEITLKMQNGELEIIQEYPTLRRQLKSYFWSPDTDRIERLENSGELEINTR